MADIDPETGCTAAEMKEEEIHWVPACPAEREIYDNAHRRSQFRSDAVSCEGKVA